MRSDFVRELTAAMQERSDIFFLTGDLGFRALEPLQQNFPDRFVNVGVAEQNLASVGAGLAMTGRKVFIYSIASFVTLRCFEQIRDDICYHNLDVTIVGTGGGFNYGHLGVTHHTVEDLAMFRALPQMKVFCPGYGWEAAAITRALVAGRGPAYLRLGKSPGKDLSRPGFDFAVGRGFAVKDGDAAVLFATGNMLMTAIEIAKRLENESGLSAGVVSIPCLKPLDRELIISKARRARGLFTLEEHNVIGGLGSAVAETLAEAGVQPPVFHSFGIPDTFIAAVGNRAFLCAQAGLGTETILQQIKERMKI